MARKTAQTKTKKNAAATKAAATSKTQAPENAVEEKAEDTVAAAEPDTVAGAEGDTLPAAEAIEPASVSKEDLLNSPEETPGVLIIAKVDGFRRAGMAHSKTETIHEPGTFTEDQIQELLAEPKLVVAIAE